MTWLWTTEDLDLRIGFARATGPSDVFTVLARYVVTRVNWAPALILTPVDTVVQIIGKIMFVVFAVIPLIFLLLLTVIWLPVWGLLVGTSWLWLRCSGTRTLLILPGFLVSLVATTVVLFEPDP